MRAVWVSSEPGSVNGALAVTAVPTGTGATGSPVIDPTLGATFVTATVPLYSVTPLSLSKIRARTLRVPSSDVAHDADASVPAAAYVVTPSYAAADAGVPQSKA